MENTSGFYKNDNGLLIYGPNFVESSDYQLYRDHHNEYSYPVGGWYWFETEENARAFFNLPMIESV